MRVRLCFATGRAPNTHGIGLEDLGVMLDGVSAIVVDRYSRTSVENIYAIGDVTNRKNLTPVALAEGRAVAETLFGKRAMSVDYDNVPSAVFSQPTIGTVGLTEAQARERFGEIDIYKANFRPLKHTLSGRDERTFMKLNQSSREANRSRGWLSHDRYRRRRDYPGLRSRATMRSYQGAVRCDDRASSDGGRGVRHDAREGTVLTRAIHAGAGAPICSARLWRR